MRDQRLETEFTAVFGRLRVVFRAGLTRRDVVGVAGGDRHVAVATRILVERCYDVAGDR